MKVLKLSLAVFFFFLSSFSFVHAGFFDSFINSSQPKTIYCNGNQCGLNEGISLVKNGINDIETQRTLSQYVQDIVKYLLLFISIIAVLYIIWAGFNILIGNGDEEKLKKSRTTIVYVIIGIIIIWLAWPITTFILKVLNIT